MTRARDLARLQPNSSGQISFANLPTGAILQEVAAMSTTMANRNNAAFGEVSTTYRVSITPKKSTSILVIEFNFNTSMDTDHYTSSFRIVDVSTGNIVGTMTNYGTRPAGHGSVRGQYNADNACNTTVVAYVAAGSTTARTYGLQARNAGNMNMGFSTADRSDAWGWAVPVTMRVTEFEQ